MKLSSLALLIISGGLILNGCGGGSSSDEIRLVSGTWSGALTKTQDTCVALNTPQTLNFTHNVNQNEDAVTLTDANGFSFLGNLVGDDGFSVDAQGGNIIGEVQCSAALANRIEYDDIHDDNDHSAAVELLITCPDSTSCQVAYSGTASRANGDPLPTQTPGPTPGGTPVPTGSCANMNPNPAAGTYSGDGGCGISEAAFQVSGSNVILEPFGANGASSFAISDANSSSATSNNTDLTIAGVAGYSCSLTCSPPITFTLSCFKEGASTCTERF